MAHQNFKRALFTGSLALSIALPGISAHALPENTTVVAGVHTDAIAMDLQGNALKVFSYADLPGKMRSKLDPATTVFHLPDHEATRVEVPAGYEFIAQPGTQVWFAPQTQRDGVIWPGWNTEDISRGEVKNDSLVMELVDAKTPQGGSVEVFQDSAFGAPTRVWSSDEDVKKYTQPVASHVHANWAFTHAGTYTLTFKVTGETVDGAPLEDTQDFTFVVGDLPADEVAPEKNDTASPSPEATEQPSASAPTATPVKESPTTQPSTPAPSHESATSPAPTFAELAESAPADNKVENHDGHHHVPEQPAAEAGKTDEQNTPQQAPAPTAPANPAPAAQNNSRSGAQQSAPQSAPKPAAEKCMATEVVVEKAPEQKTTADRAASSQDATIKTTGNKATTGAHIFTINNSSREQLTEGHFDFGAVLNGKQLSASIKDDRTSPARWVAPRSVEFVLSESAKKKMPAGMENIAPAGSDVYLIGSTQEAGVPWLGWNTQDSALSQNVKGDATLKLDSVTGPGKLSVFLTGNFGSAGQTVFNAPGDTFKVPLNTHQHGNWVFSAPGVYTATVSWHATLKDGTPASTSAELRFVVGDVTVPPAAPAEQSEAQNTEKAKTESKNESAPQGSEQKATAQGSVDTATGIVTKPDGSKVKIVGKTSSGADCTLSDNELKQAQEASAQGKLAYTGFSSAQLAGFGVLTLLAGIGTLLLARRAQRKNA
ncbi:TIGR03773 family transporter-associated surface protein [Rothia sp. ZJ932]|uniref:TIGR03773 family transporter-associated surface protein n=1 Tax=Rothia sp. ZJ932 TaxID=2810516 RepID=UPI0019677BDE|nr:TIGR03773 family transporter-associated surface protein [Rothia sp. ZJ932]QRZ61500.1 TIGR03773 family transporter-associated surface protein [Rothia sp. ZJ932]